MSEICKKPQQENQSKKFILNEQKWMNVMTRKLRLKLIIICIIFGLYTLNSYAQIAYSGSTNKAAVVEFGKTNRSEANFQDANLTLNIYTDGMADLTINNVTTKFKYVGLSAKGNSKFENIQNKKAWFTLSGNELLLQSTDSNEGVLAVFNQTNSQTVNVHKEDFRHKNKVWVTVNSKCDSKSYVQAWIADTEGRLVLMELSDDVLTKFQVSEFKQSGNQFLIKYSTDNSTEIYEFREDIFPGYYKKVNGIQLIERVVNGEVKVKNGLNIRLNQFTPMFQECESDTVAARAIANPPPQVPPLTWRWPDSKFEKVSYCLGVLNYASRSADNQVGRKMVNELSQRAALIAKRSGISESKFAYFVQQGDSDAARIYQQAFDKDMKRGQLDPTQTARGEIRYAVQECQNTLR